MLERLQPFGVRRRAGICGARRSLTMSPHRLRRGALYLPARRSRQNVNLFLREPLVHDSITTVTYLIGR
jgi:hypothetical protein